MPTVATIALAWTGRLVGLVSGLLVLNSCSAESASPQEIPDAAVPSDGGLPSDAGLDAALDAPVGCTPNDNECGPDDCGGQHSECASPLTCVNGVCEQPADLFDIVFAQSFNESPLGSYLRASWSADWGIAESAWTDPCYDTCTVAENWAEARLTIEQEGDTRFMRHVLTTKGTGPGTSGIGWWKEIGLYEELYLSFRVRFAGADWTGPSYHGKLPGFCGSAGCPGGGNPPLNYEGFSTRFMFHDVSTLFFYLYYAAMDTSDGPYGDSLPFSPYVNAPNQWRTVTQRVVLNTPGVANGIVEGFLDGLLVAQKTDMDYRNADDHRIDTLYFANFLGGSGEEPVANGDSPTCDFDDVVVFRFKDDVPDIKRGLEANNASTVIPLPTF